MLKVNQFILQLGIWIEKDGTGIGFDSSTGFKLSNGADRSPDAAWMKLENGTQFLKNKELNLLPSALILS